MVAEGEDPEHVLSVLRAFSRRDERLISLSGDEETGVVAEVTHEALFEHWRTFKEWLDASREDIRFHRRLAAAASHWHEQGCPDGLLWRPPDLNLLEGFSRRKSEDMTAAEVIFHQTSSNRQRRNENIKRLTVSALAVFLVVAISFGIFAESQRRSAEYQRNVAQEQRDAARQSEIRLLTASSRDALEKQNPVLAQLLALQALPKHREDHETIYFRAAEIALWKAWREDFEHVHLAGHKGGVSKVAFSPDGKRLATGSQDTTARLWDTEHGALIAILDDHQGYVLEVEFSSDDTLLATASYDNTARLWDAKNGVPLATLEGHSEDIISMAFSPDGKRLATGSTDMTTRLWDTTSGELLFLLEGHKDWIGDLVFSPDGTQLATGSNDGTVRLWDTKSGALLLTFYENKSNAAQDERRDDVFSVAFSPNGTRLAVGHLNDVVRLWDVKHGTLLATLSGYQEGIGYVAFSPDGMRLATWSFDKTPRLWDLETNQMIGTFAGHEGFVWQLAFSPDGRRIITSSDDRTVRVWDSYTRALLATIRGHEGKVRALAISPDGTQFATGSIDGARLWNAPHHELRPKLEALRGDGQSVRVNSFAISPDLPLFSTGSFGQGRDDFNVRIWGTQSGELIAELTEPMSHGTPLVFSPDSTLLAAVSTEGTLLLWNSRSGTLFANHNSQLPISLSGPIAFNPRGDLLATTSSDTVQLWNARSGVWRADIRLPEEVDGFPRLLAFNSDGSTLAVATSEGRIVGIEIGNNAPVWSLNAHDEWISSVAFNSDGTLLATASWDETVKVWDIRRERAMVATIKGFRLFPRSVAFFPSGNRLAILSLDLQIWDLLGEEPLATLDDGMRWSSISMTLSSDGTRLVVGYEDGTVRSFGVFPDTWSLIDTVCNTLSRRNVTKSEMRRFIVSEQPLIPTCAADQ